jgi:putative ABC transport system permease protein
MRNLPAGQGRNVSWADVQNRSRVCILGDSVRKQLFQDRKDALGSRIQINGYNYTIVGLMDEKNQNSSYDGWDNDKVLVPNVLVRSDCPPDHRVAAEGRVQVVIYRPRSVEEWDLAQEQVRGVLGRIHGFDRRDEAALPMWDTVESAQVFEDTFTALGIFLSSVAFIT